MSRINNVIEGLLIAVLGVIGYDTVLRALDANRDNALVTLVRRVSGVLLAPFEGMFSDQHYLATAMVAVLTYCLVAAVVLAVIPDDADAPIERRSSVRWWDRWGNGRGVWT